MSEPVMRRTPSSLAFTSMREQTLHFHSPLAKALSLCAALSLLALPVQAATPTPAQAGYAIESPRAEQSLLLDVSSAGARLVAVGDRGHILYSDDQGQSWQQAQVPTRQMLTALYFVDAQHGWAVGQPVYQTRRSGSAPQWVYDNSIKNATTAQLAGGGNGFSNAYGGIPFPIPQSGVEALWNHVARYRGTYIVRRASEVAVQRNGSYALVTSQQEALFKYYLKNGSFADLNNIMFYYLSFTTSPARLAGGATLVHETLDQVKEPRQAWGYNAGQRRVRRAPNLAYDTPIAAADGLRTADDTDMFNGAPDRYDWKLVGKKEVYIPYNNYQVTSPDVKYKDLLQPGHLNPAVTRNELHRVWVVEGTLKAGARHIYSKRVLFLDEDSWQAAVVDQYDGRGELWRVSIAYLKNYYDLPTTWSALDVFHDLQARRYHVQNLDNEENDTIDFSQAIPDDGYFKPAALRRRGTR